jgi:hypothetical protein
MSLVIIPKKSTITAEQYLKIGGAYIGAWPVLNSTS